MTESFDPEQAPHRVEGSTARRGQVVGIDCSVTILYDVREATGSAVLVQRFVAHLRTGRLPRGVAYELDCGGPVIAEIPSDAFDVRATATSRSGPSAVLPLKAPVTSIRLGSGRRLRAEPRTQFAVIRWPGLLPADNYHAELSFSLPAARTIREKLLYAASVSCGRSRYVQPILPPVTRMARVPAFTIRPSASAISLGVPGLSSYAEKTRTLSCVR